MESPPAATAKAPRAGSTPRCRCLPEEVIIWEILVRLPPKSLLRCRAVCRGWRRATSTRGFLLAHHGHQPSLPMVWGEPGSGSEYSGALYEDFLAFDHRADADAQLQPVVRLADSYFPQASCDGLLVLAKRDGTTGTCFSLCNPVTREHAPLGTPSDFSVKAMYLHRPTGEYRLLLHRSTGSILGCYVFALGPDQPPRPRHIQGPDAASRFGSHTPTLVRHSLHWVPEQHHSVCLVLAFDTTTESFRQIRAPVFSDKSNIFEMDGTLGIYSYKAAKEAIDIWVMENYEGEIWKYKCSVKLPGAEIRGQLGAREGRRYGGAISVVGDVLLLLSYGGLMFYINTDGKLVDSYHRDGQDICAWDLRLKQSLVPHNFFMSLH